MPLPVGATAAFHDQCLPGITDSLNRMTMEKQNKTLIGGPGFPDRLVAAYFRPDLVGFPHRPQLPPDAFPDGIRIHSISTASITAARPPAKAPHGNEIIQKDLAR